MDVRALRFAALLLAAVSAGAPLRARAGPVQETAAADTGLPAFVDRLQTIVQSADVAGYLDLLTADANVARARAFATTEFANPSTRTVLRDRDRVTLAGAPAGSAYVVQMDVLNELGDRASIATWRLTLRRIFGAGTGAERWAIADQARLSSFSGIYRLSLDATAQFRARDFRIAAEDFELSLAEGAVFLVNIDRGTTGLVLVGNGTLHFQPAPPTEQGQLEMFCGHRVLDAAFDAAFVRLNPGDVPTVLSMDTLRPVAVDPRVLRRAQDVFRDESAKSFSINLGDLSADSWSLLPGDGDLLAEVRTRQFNTLTYTRTGARAEDIGLFDRERRHTIALYASRDKLASRGPFYDEDDLSDYDILDYDVDMASTPERRWIEGTARLRLKVRAPSIGAVVLRLADPLVVRSVVSQEYGRLFAVRVPNQDTLVVNLPAPRSRGSTLTLTLAYAGRLEPQPPDQETIAATADAVDRQDVPDDGFPSPVLEPSYLYRNRSYWYPQGSATDYATATIRLSVPAPLAAMASGALQPGYPKTVAAADDGPDRAIYLFHAAQPVRYLSFVVSRFERVDTKTITFPPNGGGSAPAGTLMLSVDANPQQVRRGRVVAARAADIATFYEGLIGEAPYPTLAIALVDSTLPGGHSPAYLAVINEPLPASRLNWHGDPAAFAGYPEFFLAHEIAHQWWGHAVGWRNYHEQWLSEAFAQYFAALYAQHERGDAVFGSMLKQFRKWAMDESDQGPVYLGYRLGHLRNDSRVFRAIVYNKGAAVLHMLRRLIGDQAFFDGLRRFYRTSRFQKAGTEDLRVAMEGASGMPLGRFFERWIYGSTLPTLQLSYYVDGPDVVVRVEQHSGEVFDIPVPVTLRYADGRMKTRVITLTGPVAEQRIPLAGTLKSVGVNDEEGILATVKMP